MWPAPSRISRARVVELIGRASSGKGHWEMTYAKVENKNRLVSQLLAISISLSPWNRQRSSVRCPPAPRNDSRRAAARASERLLCSAVQLVTYIETVVRRVGVGGGSHCRREFGGVYRCNELERANSVLRQTTSGGRMSRW